MTCCNSRQKIPEVVAWSVAHAKCAITAAFSLRGRALEDAVAVVATSALIGLVCVSSPRARAPVRPAGRGLEGTLLPLVSFLCCPSACSRDSDTYVPTMHAGYHREAAMSVLHMICHAHALCSVMLCAGCAHKAKVDKHVWEVHNVGWAPTVTGYPPVL